MILLGITIEVLLDIINPLSVKDHNKVMDYFLSVFITVLVWSGVTGIYHLMTRYFPWEKGIFRRVIAHSLLSSVYTIMVIYVSMIIYNKFICQIPEGFKSEMISTSIIIGVLITFLMVAITSGAEFFRKWKATLIEAEKHKKESLQAQLENLKSQINPHFLFNNLSVLSSLVYTDQEKAVEFINQLSKVYRYVLESKDKELTDLKSEMKFIESYCYLLQIRFDKNINFQFDIPSTYHSFLIAPMALQMIVENAIKHNEISADLPLTISMRVDDEMLIVSNNLQLRKQEVESSGTGLPNIISRYHHFTDRQVQINNTSNKFEVSLPLLKAI
jgi:LytS/YehU family sensor histidine kinase